MRVLVACEESQAVTAAFRARGHEAYSCDIQHCALWNHMEWHIVEQCQEIINGRCKFQTVDGKHHEIEGVWDIIIAHPPCTYLTASSAVRLFDADHTIKDAARFQKGLEARAFFMMCLEADCPRKAVENPVPMKIWGLPPYTQIIEPYMFGDPWRKRTCLWLEGLPPLMATNMVEPRGLWVGSSSKRSTTYELRSKRDKKERSKTFPGVAQAMAEQWG